MREQRCPYCGASLVLEAGLSTFYCKYCGGRILVDDSDKRNLELRKMEHAETMKKLDNAHDFRAMEHIEKVQAEANLHERFRLEQKNKGGFRKGCVSIILILVTGFVILMAIAAFTTSDRFKSNSTNDADKAKKLAAHEKEIDRLTKIESEVLDEIAEGDFTNALVRANTIHYNVPEVVGTWGAGKKWDERREEIIKSIYQVSGMETSTPVPTAVALYLNDTSNKIVWPKCEIAKMIPIPATEGIKISWENEKGFYLEVSNFSKDQLASYADACWDQGFTLNYDKGDTHFWADHRDGYHLNLTLRGTTMSVRIDTNNQ